MGCEGGGGGEGERGGSGAPWVVGRGWVGKVGGRERGGKGGLQWRALVCGARGGGGGGGGGGVGGEEGVAVVGLGVWGGGWG